MGDRTELISQLRQRVAHLPPLPDEPEFTTSEETLIRFLKARDWKLEQSAKLLTEAIEYRRQTRPLLLDCSWCHNRPGYHPMRQVGHDEAGRPVLYSSFVQAATHKNGAEDSVAHVVYLTENAKRTMAPGVSTWVFIIDCTGMTLGACNPKLGYSVLQVLSNHYPERLGLIVCVNHNSVFHGVYAAIMKFLPPATAAKAKLVRSKAKVAELFSQLFSPELSAWLLEEIALNKQKPLPRTQAEFWNPPDDSSAHDPRGCKTYVAKYVDGYRQTLGANSDSKREKSTACEDGSTPVIRVHKPHPNIVDELSGHKLRRVSVSSEERQEAQSVLEGQEDPREDPGEGDHLDIPSELQIPADAPTLMNASS